uniref:Uncharacterized protein n=1 Tax=Arundo donax TaxID=35708 RepID=A0A0A9A0C6_ARUDO
MNNYQNGFEASTGKKKSEFEASLVFGAYELHTSWGKSKAASALASHEYQQHAKGALVCRVAVCNQLSSCMQDSSL